jgi:hypothetical protein
VAGAFQTEPADPHHEIVLAAGAGAHLPPCGVAGFGHPDRTWAPYGGQMSMKGPLCMVSEPIRAILPAPTPAPTRTLP